MRSTGCWETQQPPPSYIYTPKSRVTQSYTKIITHTLFFFFWIYPGGCTHFCRRMRNKCKRKYAFFYQFYPSLFLSGSFLSPVSAWHSSAVSGSEWQPTCNRLAKSFFINWSAGAHWSHHCLTGPRHTSATAGDELLDNFLFILCLFASYVRVTLPICAGDYSGSGSGARGRNTKAGRLFIHSRRSQGPREAVERRQCRVSQVTPRIPSPQREGPDGIKGLHVSPIFSISSALAHLYCLFVCFQLFLLVYNCM